MIDQFFQSTYKQKFLFLIFILGFIYIVLPGPVSIEDFSGLSPSVRSDLPGDTWQNENIAAYYSDFNRDKITKYYKDFFSKTIFFGLPLPMIAINRPPEEAYQYVRDQQESTFLEEYVFPMRESLFVNGYEPKVENDMFPGRERSFVGDHLSYNQTYFNSKATLRFYTSNVLARIMIYLGIWVAIYGIYLISVKLIKEK